VLDADELISAWDKRFNQYSYNNPVYSRLCLHLILGQILRNQKVIKHGIEIDGRFNFFLVQSSGSGKSTALKFVIDVADYVGLDFESITDWSDAALIGTIESKDDEAGKKKYEQIKGILDGVDILHIDEASLLFSPSKYNQSTLSYLQLALNPIGSPSNRIRKKLRAGEFIDFHPHLSLFLTSYNPTKVGELVTTRGILQRMAVYVRFLSMEERLKNAYTDIDYLGTPAVDKSHLEEQIKVTLRSISDHYSKPENVIDFDDKVKPLLKSLAKRLYDATVNINPFLQEHISSFLPRYLTMLYVVALHHAALRFSNFVEDVDIRYAYKLTRVMFDSVIVWLEQELERESKEKTKERKSALKAIITIFNENSKDGSISRARLVRLVSERTGRSEKSIYRYLNDPEIKRLFVVDKTVKRRKRK